MSYLNDRQFLYELDNQKIKEIYIRIFALDFEENIVEFIEGRATGGSINIDGASAVRRTCNLTLVAKDVNLNNYYWGLNNKFKVEIGVSNRINNKYPDIIWFKQGVYFITGFNTSVSNNNYTISISGKDKMAQLNGDIGGNLPSSIDFGTIEEILDNGERVITQLPIKRIIKEMIYAYANEPYYNIIINDLDNYGVELLENKTNKAMYMFRKIDDGSILNVTFNDQMKVYENGNSITLDSENIKYYNLNLLNNQEATKITFSNDSDAPLYNVIKIDYGETVGYRPTEMVYTGDLISSIGETITSVLDKIIKMLGDFEYFYDLDGRFIFQKKKTYLNTSWNQIVKADGETYVDTNPYNTSLAYTFEGSNLVTALSHNPNLQNIRNDFVIWGQRKSSSSGSDKALAIHARYAIDKKPEKYTNYDGITYAVTAQTENQTSTTGQKAAAQFIICDWREIIYQMAKDYRKYNQNPDFLITLAENNPHYPTGITGYEKYYTDMEGFWRQLYTALEDIKIENPKRTIESYYYLDGEEWKEKKFNNDFIEFVNKVDLNGIEVEWENIYYKTLENEKIYLASRSDNPTNEQLKRIYYYEEKGQEIELQNILRFKPNTPIYYSTNEYSYKDTENYYWHQNVSEAPYLLHFWIDFIDTKGDLDKFSIPAIGNRPKVINETTVNAIYFEETPLVLFVDNVAEASKGQPTGYTYIQLPESESIFSVSAQGLSTKDKFDELLYQHTYALESVALTTLPIYYLEPNVRIQVNDIKSQIQGDYIVSKITIPLTYNGTMSISATKAPKRIV